METTLKKTKEYEVKKIERVTLSGIVKRKYYVRIGESLYNESEVKDIIISNIIKQDKKKYEKPILYYSDLRK